MRLHTHKDRTDNINLLEIAKEFTSFNDSQINFFGHFLMFNNNKIRPSNLNFIPTPLNTHNKSL